MSQTLGPSRKGSCPPCFDPQTRLHSLASLRSFVGQHSPSSLAPLAAYNNYPNTGTSKVGTAGACVATAGGCFANTLPVGVCTEFPGPVKTWKMIVKSTYTCTGSSPATSDSCTGSGASTTGGATAGTSAAAQSTASGVVAVAAALVGLAAVL